MNQTTHLGKGESQNLPLFLVGIALWTIVAMICIILHIYSLCKRLKTTRIHCLLTLYCPIRIVHSLLEFLFWKQLDQSGTETEILYNLAYILESLSLSLLIFIFQLVTAGYLIIEKKINFCKIKKSLILICCLILSFLQVYFLLSMNKLLIRLTLFVNWLISISLFLIFFIFLKMMCIDQFRNKNTLINLKKELQQQNNINSVPIKLKISLLESLNRWAWIFTILNSTFLAVSTLVNIQQKYLYSFSEQFINFLFYLYFLVLFRISNNDARFVSLDDLNKSSKANDGDEDDEVEGQQKKDIQKNIEYKGECHLDMQQIEAQDIQVCLSQPSKTIQKLDIYGQNQDAGCLSFREQLQVKIKFQIRGDQSVDFHQNWQAQQFGKSLTQTQQSKQYTNKNQVISKTKQKKRRKKLSLYKNWNSISIQAQADLAVINQHSPQSQISISRSVSSAGFGIQQQKEQDEDEEAEDYRAPIQVPVAVLIKSIPMGQ